MGDSMSEIKELNDFTFSGFITKKPEKKPSGDMTVVETILEQSNTYNKKTTIRNLAISAFHDQARILLELKVGDYVLVKGTLSSKPYEDKRTGDTRYYINHIANSVFVGKLTQDIPEPSIAEVKPEFNMNDVPF